MALAQTGENLHPLIEERLALSEEIGRCAATLCQAHVDYQECLGRILATDLEIRQQGIGRSALEPAPIADAVMPPDIHLVK